MARFILGAVCATLVHLVGWDTITGWLDTANHAARSAYTTAQTQADRVKVSK